MVTNYKCLHEPTPFLNMDKIRRTPWDTYVAAFPVVDGVYYISANNWVAAYLIDTGEGLILIDTGLQETLYLMIYEIHRLGYELQQIKKILLSHAHIDHIGGARPLQELTGAEIYLGKRDLYFLTDRRDLILGGEECLCGSFLPDKFYEDEPVITMGDISIRAISTPGHTPGCTSFVFKVRASDAKTYTCAMMGGLGIGNLTDEELKKSGLPVSLRQEYMNSLEKLLEIHVDIVLPSHPDQYDILEKLGARTDNQVPLTDPAVWDRLLRQRIEKAKQL